MIINYSPAPATTSEAEFIFLQFQILKKPKNVTFEAADVARAASQIVTLINLMSKTS
jgi:hypothetical protein